MGKVTLKGLSKPGDPVFEQRSIVLGPLRGRSKKPSEKRKQPAQDAASDEEK